MLYYLSLFTSLVLSSLLIFFIRHCYIFFQFIPKQKLSLASCLVPCWLLLVMQEGSEPDCTIVHCSIPTFDPSVQHCMAREVFFAYECLGTLFTFIWLGSLMNILDVHNQARPTIERLAAVLACIAVLSCRSNND